MKNKKNATINHTATEAQRKHMKEKQYYSQTHPQIHKICTNKNNKQDNINLSALIIIYGIVIKN